MSEKESERKRIVKEKILEALGWHKSGIGTDRIANEVARVFKIGTMSFEVEIEAYLRELEREGLVERVPKRIPDDFVWHGEKGSEHSFVVWRLKKKKSREPPKENHVQK